MSSSQNFTDSARLPPASPQPTPQKADAQTSDVAYCVTDTFKDKFLWMFILVAIVIVCLCFGIAYNEADWYSNLNNWTWASSMMWVSIILFIIVLIVAYCSYLGYNSAADDTTKGWILATFFATLLILMVWFYVFFKAKTLDNAFYVSILFLFVVFVQTYLIWSVNYKAGYGMILYALWAIFLASASWYVSANNGNE